MKFLILTALFPPDTGAPALYVKGLAKRLPAAETGVIAYGKLQEAVPGVTIHTINKQSNKVALVYRCLKQLFSLKTELLIVNNGPSVELPALLFSLFSKTPVLLIISDSNPHKYQSGLHSFIHKTLVKRSVATIEACCEEEYIAPEKLPFNKSDEKTLASHTKWWDQHLNKILSYAK